MVKGRSVQVILGHENSVNVFESLDSLWPGDMSPQKPTPHNLESFRGDSVSVTSIHSSGLEDDPLTDSSTENSDTIDSSDTEGAATTATGAF